MNNLRNNVFKHHHRGPRIKHSITRARITSVTQGSEHGPFAWAACAFRNSLMESLKTDQNVLSCYVAQMTSNGPLRRSHAKLQFLVVFIKTKIHLHKSIYRPEFCEPVKFQENP